jgi:hypothetical protein
VKLRLLLSAVAVIALSSTADARPRVRKGVRSSRATPRFQGKRVPKTTDLVKRDAKTTRSRRAARPDRAGRKKAPTHVASGSDLKSDSGKLAITKFSAVEWKVGGLYLSTASYGQVDFAVRGTEGKHVTLTCDVNATEKNMSLLLFREDGTMVMKKLETGHQFVKFSIPTPPEDFDFTLMGSNGVNSIMHHSWILYGCRMELK